MIAMMKCPTWPEVLNEINYRDLLRVGSIELRDAAYKFVDAFTQFLNSSSNICFYDIIKCARTNYHFDINIEVWGAPTAMIKFIVCDVISVRRTHDDHGDFLYIFYTDVEEMNKICV